MLQCNMTSTPLVWLITGCSSGIGRELTVAAIERGDKVIATTRKESFLRISDLETIGAHIMQLDVTSSLDELKQLASQVIEVYGKVDVVVNNAGFCLSGSLEETSHEDTLNQFNTNLFGALNVTRAFLPCMRKQKTGTIAFIGSCYGWRGFRFAGNYAATKFALRGISESLNLEISPFGLRSICFDSGCYRTPIIDKRQRWISILDAYKDAGQEAEATLSACGNSQRGDPVLGVNRIIDVIKGEGLASGKEVPIEMTLGVDCYEVVKSQCQITLARLEEWKDLTHSTDFPAKT